MSGKRVWVAGHRGMVGSALLRRLSRENCELPTVTREELDLCRQADVETYVERIAPDAIVIAAARVGGIVANQTFPVEFLENNVLIATNVIAAAHRANVKRLVFVSSASVYPVGAPQPITEESLGTGPLDSTHTWYATAKLAGMRIVEAHRAQFGRDYFAVVPTNLYGPNDNFEPASAHVMPALIRKVHEAIERGDDTLTIWGTGAPRREFLHVDDCADAIVHLLTTYNGAGHVNLGSGTEITIKDLVALISEIAGFAGRIEFDTSRPDGVARRQVSIEKLKSTGWSPRIGLSEGISETYKWYRHSNIRAGAAL